MTPVAAYGGSDDRSMAADNTSGFNCRYAVAPGPKRWSVHAYGEAIDVNTIENPYVEGGRVLPPAGAAFVDRGRVRPGMAVRGRHARARVRRGRLALGRALDRLPRLAALLEDRGLIRTGFGYAEPGSDYDRGHLERPDVLEPVDLCERREEAAPDERQGDRDRAADHDGRHRAERGRPRAPTRRRRARSRR